MASSAPGEQDSPVYTGQKRKREDDGNDEDHDINAEDVQDESSGKMDINDLIPDDEDGDDEEEEESDDSDANPGEENANHPTHDESDEPLPPCAIYDDAIEDIEGRLVSIPQQLIYLLEESKSSSKPIKALRAKAEQLKDVPTTDRIRIAILGGAGVGKSSLLNAVTGKADLAKSVGIRPGTQT